MLIWFIYYYCNFYGKNIPLAISERDLGILTRCFMTHKGIPTPILWTTALEYQVLFPVQPDLVMTACSCWEEVGGKGGTGPNAVCLVDAEQVFDFMKQMALLFLFTFPAWCIGYQSLPACPYLFSEPGEADGGVSDLVLSLWHSCCLGSKFLQFSFIAGKPAYKANSDV